MNALRIINDFKISEYEGKNNEKILEIQYLRSGEFFTSSRYKNVDEVKIQKVKRKLKDFTKTNQLAETQCQSIPLITMIHEVERIIFNH